MALSLTEYNTSAAAAIAAGSKVEIAGAFFQFSGDEAINAASWTAIATGSTAYIALTASGTAGSQVVTAAYTATAPTWRDDLQGWYASVASSVRVVGSVYKAEATSYYPKYILSGAQEGSQRNINTNSCTVGSSLLVGGVVSVNSSLSVAGNIYHDSGIDVCGSIFSSSITRGSVFSILSPFIPDISSEIIMSGGISTGTELAIVSRASRDSSSTISIYSSAKDWVDEFTITSSNTSILIISVAW